MRILHYIVLKFRRDGPEWDYTRMLEEEQRQLTLSFVHGARSAIKETKVKPCWGRWLRGFEFKIFISFLLDFH
jgi:hypothetical protein